MRAVSMNRRVGLAASGQRSFQGSSVKSYRPRNTGFCFAMNDRQAF